ncbi:MAG: adenosylcobinamide amidohydrolase [Trichlorobacter sp.]|nr:adenosylcobinamide amidohydrolase [Trichlorobacter sp.]
MKRLFMLVVSLLFLPVFAQGADIHLPANLHATAQVVKTTLDNDWEKTLLVTFAERRRTLATFDGFVEAMAAMNHSASPLLWEKVSKEFMSVKGCGGQVYMDVVRERLARDAGLEKQDITKMATAADMDNLAVVTKEFKPFTVTVLATAGARTNAIRTGVDEGIHIEGEEPKGTINIMLLTNAQLTDGAMARAIITVTEAKTAALQDLDVQSSYTPDAQATGTGTDSVIVVAGTTGPTVTYTGGHSRIGELIGKAAYEAVIEALVKQNGFKPPAPRPLVSAEARNEKAASIEAEKWLWLLDEGRFPESWDASSELSRRSIK